jgi:hypothetical protein
MRNNRTIAFGLLVCFQFAACAGVPTAPSAPCPAKLEGEHGQIHELLTGQRPDLRVTWACEAAANYNAWAKAAAIDGKHPELSFGDGKDAGLQPDGRVVAPRAVAVDGRFDKDVLALPIYTDGAEIAQFWAKWRELCEKSIPAERRASCRAALKDIDVESFDDSPLGLPAKALQEAFRNLLAYQERLRTVEKAGPDQELAKILDSMDFDLALGWGVYKIDGSDKAQ